LAENVLAMVRTAPSKMELREFPVPMIADDAALMKVEVAGICGTDVKTLSAPTDNSPGDHGPRKCRHDRQGWQRVRAPARASRRRSGFVEHYVSCGKCEWLHKGEYRHAKNTDGATIRNRSATDSSSERAPHLLGWLRAICLSSVEFRRPPRFRRALVGAGRPRHADGERVRVSLFDGNVGTFDGTDPGPGQQGLRRLSSANRRVPRSSSSLWHVEEKSGSRGESFGRRHVINVHEEKIRWHASARSRAAKGSTSH